MSPRRKQVESVEPAQELITGEPQLSITEAEPTKKAKERISLPLAANGAIDWASTRESSKQKFAAALMADPETLRSFGLGKMDATVSDTLGPVTSEHFAFLLTLYEMGERYAIPAYLAKQSKGQVRISPEIAAQAFHFNDAQREKICPLGAQVLNQHLPEWLKAWIAKTGPVSELLAMMAGATYMQTRAALEMWKAQQPQQSPTVDAEQPAQVQ